MDGSWLGGDGVGGLVVAIVAIMVIVALVSRVSRPEDQRHQITRVRLASWQEKQVNVGSEEVSRWQKVKRPHDEA